MHQKLLDRARKSPILLIFSILFFEVGAIFLILQTKLISKLISDVIFFEKTLEQFSKLIIFVYLLILFRSLFNFGGEIFAKQVALKIKNNLRLELVKSRILKNNSESLHSGASSVIFYDQVEAIEAYFSQFIPQVFLSILIPLSILIFIFPLDLITGIILLTTAPLIPFFMVLIGKYSEKHNLKQWESLSDLSVFFLDSLRGLRTLISFQQRKRHIKRIQKANQDYVDNSLIVLRITFLSALALELLSTVAIAVVAVEIGLRLLYFRISFEQAFFILLIAPEFYLPLRNLGLRFHAAINGVVAFREIDKLINLPRIDQSQTTKSILSNQISVLSCKDVSFQYPKETSQLINNFSFDFEKGMQYALVGPNGAGKTTIFKLLLGLLQPSTGKILLDNRDISLLEREEYFSQFSWLPQNSAIFRGSILDNITIANPNLSLDEVMDILAKVNLWEFVNGLPNGLKTEVQEFGMTISSGQKQRIGLARLICRNSSVILCDEPTSSSDPIFEKIILEELRSLKKNKIIISIAHRVQTIKNADRILFFQKGQPVIKGCFKDLFENEDSFRKFIKLYSGELND